MTKNVLLVDDDRDMLISLKKSLAKYTDSFSLLLAGDGLEAFQYLEKLNVSLVVADVNMPRMDGFELLANLTARFPDIPVVIMTGLITAYKERLTQQASVAAIISKPFLVERLAEKIITILHRETEGGALPNVSSGTFLQLIKMEQKTCTIRLKDRSTAKVGVLFFVEGVLFDARVGAIQGQRAAYEILAWDPVDLSIQNSCAVRQRRISADLQRIILEAARRRDEMRFREQASFAPGSSAPAVSQPSEFRKGVRKKIENALGERCELASVFEDDSWTERVRRISRLGEQMRLGKLMVAYIGRADPHDYVVLDDEPPTVLAVSPKCPRDQVMQLLGG
jgi:CheY-like chemotaxis protein